MRAKSNCGLTDAISYEGSSESEEGRAPKFTPLSEGPVPVIGAFPPAGGRRLGRFIFAVGGFPLLRVRACGVERHPSGYESREFHPRDHPEYRSGRPLRYADFDKAPHPTPHSPCQDMRPPLLPRSARRPFHIGALSAYQPTSSFGGTGHASRIVKQRVFRSHKTRASGPRRVSGGSALGVSHQR